MPNNPLNYNEADFEAKAFSDSEAGFEVITKDDEALNELESYAFSELVARLSYDLSKPESAENAKQILASQGYTVHPLNVEGPEASGIHLYAVVPQDPSKPAILAGRGTADITSAIRDLDPNGAGNAPLTQNRASLLKQIQAVAGNHQKFNFTGHSLGGALAQLMCTFVMTEKAEQPDFLPNMTELSACTFQSTGVSPAIAAEARESAQALANRGLQLSSTSFRRTSDVINITGQQILCDLDPKVVKVSLIEENHRDNEWGSDLSFGEMTKAALSHAQSLLLGKPLAAVGLDVAANIAWSLLKKMHWVRHEAHTRTFFWEKVKEIITTSEDDFEIVQEVANYREKAGLLSYEGRTQIITNETTEGQQELTKRLSKDPMRNCSFLHNTREKIYDNLKETTEAGAHEAIESVQSILPKVKGLFAGFSLLHNGSKIATGAKELTNACAGEGLTAVEKAQAAGRGFKGIGSALSNLYQGAKKLLA